MSSNAANNGRRKVVVAPVAIGSGGVSWMRILPVWILSAVVHGAVLALFFVLMMVFSGLQPAVAQEEEQVTTTTQVEEQPKDVDLTNTDLGNDDSTPLNYNVDRIEDVSVPGMVDPTQSVGIPGAPTDAPRTNVPLPPGVGTQGLGGALSDLPDAAAIGGMSSVLGGMGGQHLLGQFAGRSGATREKMLKEGGGNSRSEKAVADGLQWLALHQAQDGHWSLHECNRMAREKPRPAGKVSKCNCEPGSTHRSDVAATGFGLLPFLASGITHRPGNKRLSKDYTKTVEGGIHWLMSKQSPSNGSYTSDMYAHGIATIAMCEAYGLSRDQRVLKSAQRALNFIVSAQDKAGGGWRYTPGQAGDLSVTGWQLMALKSGQMAGLSVPKNILTQAKRFLDACEVMGGKGKTKQGGGFSYLPGQGETITMTSVGLLCRMYSGVGPGNPSLLAGVQKLKAYPPDKHPDVYYLYYATQVMHHMEGESWRFWNTGQDEKGQKKSKGIRDMLISKQDVGTNSKHAHQIGSWGGSAGGRVMATSLSLLCLEVYYRHLPLYRRDLNFMKDGK